MKTKLHIIFLIIFLTITCCPMDSSFGQDLSYDFKFIRSWGAEGEQFSSIADACYGPDGMIYAVDSGFNRVVIIDPASRIIRIWGEIGTGDGEFTNPSSIVVDSLVNVYIVDSSNRRIQKYTSDGNFITQWSAYNDEEGFGVPKKLAFDESGNIYVTFGTLGVIQKFTPEGVFLQQIGNGRGSLDGMFYTPQGLAIDSNGNIYVADTWNYRVQKFSPSGEFITKWGSQGTGPGQFESVQDIEIDSYGNIVVTDGGNHRIQIFSPDGIYLDEIIFGYEDFLYQIRPSQISFTSDGKLLLVDRENDLILKFHYKGSLITHWGKNSKEPGQFFNPDGIDIDSNNNLYVAEWFNNRIQVFTSAGSFVSMWGNEGAGQGEFLYPLDVAVDQYGYVYVADTGNNRIQKFTSTGTFIKEWGGEGVDPGQFNYLTGITIDNGILYAADSTNDRIQLFDLNGNLQDIWDSTGNPEAPLDHPHDIAIDDNNYFYVTNASSDYPIVLKLTDTGEYVTHWGELGRNDGQFEWPERLAVDLDGNIHVTDTNTHRVQKFTPEGQFIQSWTEYGNQEGQILDAQGIAFGDNGNVYVVDSRSQRISVFNANLPTIDPNYGLIQNGGFEGTPTLSEWTYSSDLPVISSTNSVEGSSSLQLGIPVSQTDQGQGEAWAHTTVYIPEDWDRPFLSFNYRMFVNDIMDYSDFFVTIQDGVGVNHQKTVIRDGFQPCLPNSAPSAGKDLGWRHAGIDLSEYKGQYIRIKFSTRNLWPISWGIWTNIDNIKLLNLPPQPDLPLSLYIPIMANNLCSPEYRSIREGQSSLIRPEIN